VAFLLFLQLPVAARAQTVQPIAPLPSFDAAAYLGRTHVLEAPEAEERYRPGYGVADGAASFGFYWTEHVKTEVDANWSSAGRFQGSTFADVPGVPPRLPIYTFVTYRTRTLTLAQTYQFLHNAWFHPFLAAGVDLGFQRERVEVPEQRYYPPTTFVPPGPPVTPAPITIPGRAAETSTELVTRVFGGAGFKAYMTPRTFFRVDGRLGMGSDSRTTRVRFGFGVDF
jgi:hypothetical protein